jgi:polyisoprenoid-binding protein YceI
MSTTDIQIPSGAFAVDTLHSSIGFAVRYNGIAPFRSTFTQYDATFADGVLTGSADVTTVDIDEPSFKGHLMTGEFFDAESSPTITFRSTAVEVAADGAATVPGELTIRGVTHAVVATGRFAAGADPTGAERIAFELAATIDRRDFGITFQNELPNGGDALEWDVTLTAELQLVRQQA